MIPRNRLRSENLALHLRVMDDTRTLIGALLVAVSPTVLDNQVHVGI
jgi:hypothetical protein